MIEFGLLRRLSRIVTVTELRMDHILRRAGWLTRIREPDTIGVTRAGRLYRGVEEILRVVRRRMALALRCCPRYRFA
ncbi:MAG: hypothetical protein E5Y09_33280 [Mesorhizobium sp.]|nr:MAG: hypothetical protein E5Y09_33280 [Mesorhizobium sp.]